MAQEINTLDLSRSLERLSESINQIAGLNPARNSAAEAELARMVQQSIETQRQLQARLSQAAPAGPGLASRMATSALSREGIGTATSALGSVARLAPDGSNALQSLGGALSAFNPAAGLAVSAASALGGAMEAVRRAFTQIQPTLAETSGILRQLQTDLNQGRQSGLSAAEQMRNAFQLLGRAPQLGQIARIQTQIQSAENQGNTERANQLRGQQRAILIQERSRAQAELNATGGGALAEEESQRFASTMTATMNEFRGAGALRRAGLQTRFRNNAGGVGQGAQFVQQMWTRAGNRLEDMPEELRTLNVSELTPQRIQQMAQAFTARSVNNRAIVEQTTNAINTGVPSLRPGAPGLEQLPGLFQSRQGDVLDMHAQVQQELVRDQREEARFQRQYRLWEEILAEFRRINGQPAVVGA